MAFPHLFSPFSIGPLQLKNRVVMAPMESKLANADGSVSERSVAYYTARARGGAALVNVEFTCVDATDGYGTLLPQYRLDGDEFIAGHRTLVDALHAAGAKACVQLSHAGRQAVEKNIGRQPVAPSAVYLALTQTTPRVLEEHEIWRIIRAYASAARRALAAGYDAVMLHGAHGYLLTQFLSPFLNRRDDAWGGDFERRLRFPLEVIAAVKAELGETPLLYRMSVDEFMDGGLTIADSERITPRLAAAGVQAFDISIGTLDRHDLLVEDMSIPEGWRLPMARRIRVAAGVPVICAGVIRQPDMAERAIAEGDTDVISLGRALLADPEWPLKAEAGRVDDIVPCTSCNWCIANVRARGRVGCAENPRCGDEIDPPLSTAGAGRRAIVVGAGPGGMAAALYFDEAGFETTLYERRDFVGGGLIASATPPFKGKLFWYRDYLHRRLARSGVMLKLADELDANALAELQPEAVIIARGAAPKRMDFDGADRANVGFAIDLLMGDLRIDALPPGPLLVYGGGETGCETAEFLAAQGRRVALVTRSLATQLARAAEVRYRVNLLKRMHANPLITIHEERTLEALDDTGATLAGAAGERIDVPAAFVLIAQGFVPSAGFEDQLRQRGIAFSVIGDANAVGRIGDAVNGAYHAVRALASA